jgi:hypothetical protein
MPVNPVVSANENPVDVPEQKRLTELAAKWKTETRFISNITTKSMHIAYQKIIGMGPNAVSLILKDLVENGPNDWFWALSAITDRNPITSDIAGNTRAMTEAWIACEQDEQCFPNLGSVYGHVVYFMRRRISNVVAPAAITP